MKALLMLVLGLILWIGNAEAQSLSPVVISTSGSFLQNGSAMLSSTVGEMTMVKTFSGGNSILTQGFQQTSDIDVGLHTISHNNTLSIFPNPTSGNTTILLPTSAEEFEVIVFDAIGKIVFRKTVHSYSPDKVFHFSLEELTNGAYILKVKTKEDYYSSRINLIK